MSDASSMDRAISRRARVAVARIRDARVEQGPSLEPPDPGLVASLRHHLLGGETHYPVRPGMVDLRKRVAGRLTRLGLPPRGADSVLITASEGEALFVTILGLDLFPDGSLVGMAGGRHQALLDWMGISIEDESQDTSDGVVRYRVPASGVSVVVLADALFRENPPTCEPDEVLVGSFSSLVGMAPFTLGFAAAEPDVVKRITKWKQASSICSPAPSQRAALWALGVRP